MGSIALPIACILLVSLAGSVCIGVWLNRAGLTCQAIGCRRLAQYPTDLCPKHLRAWKERGGI